MGAWRIFIMPKTNDEKLRKKNKIYKRNSLAQLQWKLLSITFVAVVRCAALCMCEERQNNEFAGARKAAALHIPVSPSLQFLHYVVFSHRRTRSGAHTLHSHCVMCPKRRYQRASCRCQNLLLPERTMNLNDVYRVCCSVLRKRGERERDRRDREREGG